MRLVIDRLSKQHAPDAWGLRDFSLDLSPGVLGLLGPNGAGKSTLMRILATVAEPTTGTVTWNGNDVVAEPDELRATLGYLPQDFGVYPNLTAVEFLDYLAAMKGLDKKTSRSRIDELLELLGLTEARHKRLGSYSGGMRQRVGIAQALLNDPQLLIVDEPTVGLDPTQRARFRNLLSELSGERIVILSTHIVSDIEATALEIAVINDGRLVTHTTPEALLSEVEDLVWTCVVPSSDLPALSERHLVSTTIRRADGIHARVVAPQPPTPDAVTSQPSLEEAYLYAISRDNLSRTSNDAT